MKKVFICLFFCLAFSNVSNASTFNHKNLVISERVASNLINYIKGNIGFGNQYAYNKPISFWVTEDGRNSYFWYTQESVPLARHINIEKSTCERLFKKKCFQLVFKRTLIFNNINNETKKIRFTSRQSNEEIKNLLIKTNLFEKLSSNFFKINKSSYHSRYVDERLDE